ncbi:MAG: hypothetical protein Q9159_000678 [Coniocarpon cinnabarinum]
MLSVSAQQASGADWTTQCAARIEAEFTSGNLSADDANFFTGADGKANSALTLPDAYGVTLRYAQTVVEETIQNPMRAWGPNEELSSLVALRANHAWWEIMHDRLKHARRGVTASLIIQVIIAVVAWIFTVIDAIRRPTDVGSSNAMATSTMWTWILPVVVGWVKVGTHAKVDTLQRALQGARPIMDHLDQSTGNDEHRATRLRDSRGSISDSYASGCMKGTIDTILLGETIMPSHHEAKEMTLDDAAPEEDPCTDDNKSQQAEASDETVGEISTRTFLPESSLRMRRTPQCAGAQNDRGPCNNYARLLTHYAFHETLYSAFATLIDRAQTHAGPRDEAVQEELDQAAICHALTVQSADDHAMSLAPILGRTTYLPWSHIPLSLWRDVITAMLIAIFLQWGTTGAALLIGLYTPPMGFGCRSASYVLYGMLSSCTFLLLVGASMLSHQIMLRRQVGKSEKATGAHALRFFFGLFRLVGNIIGAANAVWLVLSSILMLAGFYDTCWCNANWIAKHGQWGVFLFRSIKEMNPLLPVSWGSGVAFSASVCALTTFVLWLGSSAEVKERA